MLGKLKIHCIYEKNGCKEILLLENITNHEKFCRFEKRICDKCSCERSANHDCVKSLLESKQRLTENDEKLQTKLKHLE